MKKILCIILMIFSLFCIVGCSEPYDPDEVIFIQMYKPTVPDKVEKSKMFMEMRKFALELTYSNKSTELIQFTKEMISEEDYSNLFTVGTHTIEVTYKNLTTSFTIEIYEVEAKYYTVSIVYPDDTPVLEEVIIKWIKNVNNSFRSYLIDGQSQIPFDGNEYQIHLLNIPKGYTYNPNIYKISESNESVVIKLVKLSVFEAGDGSKKSPFVMNEGTYNVSFDLISIGGMRYYVFEPIESGTYTIESFAEDKYPTTVSLDPYFGFLGETIDLGNVDYSGNQESYVNINFKYTFEAEANKKYYFIMFVSTATDLPASFDVKIYK